MLVGVLAALIVGTAAVVVYAWRNDKPDDISNPDVEFQATPVTKEPPKPR